MYQAPSFALKLGTQMINFEPALHPTLLNASRLSNSCTYVHEVPNGLRCQSVWGSPLLLIQLLLIYQILGVCQYMYIPLFPHANQGLRATAMPEDEEQNNVDLADENAFHTLLPTKGYVLSPLDNVQIRARFVAYIEK